MIRGCFSLIVSVLAIIGLGAVIFGGMVVVSETRPELVDEAMRRADQAVMRVMERGGR